MAPPDQYSPPQESDEEEIEDVEEFERFEMTNEEYQFKMDDSTVKLAFPGFFLRSNYVSFGANYAFTPEFLKVEKVLSKAFQESSNYLADIHDTDEPITNFNSIGRNPVLIRNGLVDRQLESIDIHHYLVLIKEIYEAMIYLNLPQEPKFGNLKEPANFTVPKKFEDLDYYKLTSLRILHNISKPNSLVKIIREAEEERPYLIYYYCLEFRSFRNLIYLLYNLDPLSPVWVYNKEGLKDFAAYFSEIPETQEKIYQILQEEAKLDPYL